MYIGRSGRKERENGCTEAVYYARVELSNLTIAKATEFCYISTHILRIYRKCSYRCLFLPIYNPLLRQSEYIAGN